MTPRPEFRSDPYETGFAPESVCAARMWGPPPGRNAPEVTEALSRIDRELAEAYAKHGLPRRVLRDREGF